MKSDQLLRCSTPGCTHLVRLNESWHYSELVDAPPGRYCEACTATYERVVRLTQEQCDRLLGSLLRRARMLPGQTPPPGRRDTVRHGSARDS